MNETQQVGSNTQERVNEFVNDMAKELAGIVKQIESSTALTRNHYGDYGGLIGRLSKGNKTLANLLALALIKAGANEQGVKDGLKNFI